MAACVAIGIVIGWWLRATGGPRPAVNSAFEHQAAPLASISSGAGDRSSTADKGGSSTRAAPPPSDTPIIAADPRDEDSDSVIEMLRKRHLRAPIDGVDPSTFKGGFSEHRAGEGGHPHDAVDIAAARNTPVHAVDDGTIARIFESRAGGHTIYQFDPTERVCYYYAHLERYASTLHDGQRISSGDVIGYVGTSGNAPAGSPHLHFAIFELGPDHRWWKGQAIDPYLAYRR
jgi:murein DD-endopeptidase MepM/ murein hydrolase activator NlpD